MYDYLRKLFTNISIKSEFKCDNEICIPSNYMTNDHPTVQAYCNMIKQKFSEKYRENIEVTGSINMNWGLACQKFYTWYYFYFKYMSDPPIVFGTRLTEDFIENEEFLIDLVTDMEIQLEEKLNQ